MPLPKPNDGETQDEFMSRCMGNETMNSEYPEQDQRSAVCATQWDKKDDAPEPEAEADGKDIGVIENKADTAGAVEVRERDRRKVVCQYKVNSIDRTEKTAVFTINSDHVDRDKEVVLPSGAKLAHYERNPVVLWGHDYSGLPIGKALWTRKVKEDGRSVLVSKVKFAPTDFAAQVFELVAEGFIQTASVGFIPDDFSGRAPKEAELKSFPDWVHAERVFDSWELLEWSVVPVPSNPMALARSVMSGKITLPKGMSLSGMGIGDAAEADPVPSEYSGWEPDAHEAVFEPAEAFVPGSFRGEARTVTDNGKTVQYYITLGKHCDQEMADGIIARGTDAIYKAYYPSAQWSIDRATAHAADHGAEVMVPLERRIRRLAPVAVTSKYGDVIAVARPQKPDTQSVKRITSSTEIRALAAERMRGQII